MQKLVFEDKWEKTIAEEDRLRIQEIFANLQSEQKDGLFFIPIRQAVNHRDDLLVSVLIHNATNEPITFEEKNVKYLEDCKVMGEYFFTLPVRIEAYTSMPWTFIFPKSALNNYVSLENGRLTI
ncbi:SLAP domain-containing protein [Radiobacillus deserti]|uniref:SLAP domain-containing protein n=1 Tax=Radiobacillus deserti TaxID=2594883 RepID=A0A516KET9_9BACI|nr:SLAP domain-containing protein [Radiobacillus deserti]QDP39909.1 SLAP domain-containing protein [Radiobacillus deserti]